MITPFVRVRTYPDKEFRYLRTVIVTAAVHWGFSSHRKAFPLTFQHRAGVTPYTSTFVLAESCVFGKQFRGLFCCGPHIVRCVELQFQKHGSISKRIDGIKDTLLTIP